MKFRKRSEANLSFCCQYLWGNRPLTPSSKPNSKKIMEAMVKNWGFYDIQFGWLSSKRNSMCQARRNEIQLWNGLPVIGIIRITNDSNNLFCVLKMFVSILLSHDSIQVFLMSIRLEHILLGGEFFKKWELSSAISDTKWHNLDLF